MPYVFFDTLPEGAAEADVVTRDDFEAVADEVERLTGERDTLAHRVEDLDGQLKKARADYSRVVLDGIGKPGPETPARKPATLASFRKGR